MHLQSEWKYKNYSAFLFFHCMGSIHKSKLAPHCKINVVQKNGDGWVCDSTCLWNIDKCNTYAFTWVVTTQGATTCFLYNYNFCLCESIFTQGVDQRAITLTSCKLRSMRVFLPFSTNVMPPLLFQQITWFLATYHQYRE